MPLQWKPIPELSKEERSRFFEKIDKSNADGCWLWTGTVSDSGYGICLLGRRRFKATRVLHYLMTGNDPQDAVIRHTCDVKACTRFDHTIRGTNQDNMNDAVERKRFARGSKNGVNTHPECRCIGEAQPGSKLTEAQVLKARMTYERGGTTARSIAKSLGVTGSVITRVLRGEIWKHVGGKTWDKLPKGPIPGRLDYTNNGKRKRRRLRKGQHTGA